MKYLFLLIIKLYWIIPKRRRKKCIFHETCSRHTYKAFSEKGVREGVRILKQRTKQCRPGFYQINSNEYRLADKSIVKAIELNL